MLSQIDVMVESYLDRLAEVDDPEVVRYVGEAFRMASRVVRSPTDVGMEAERFVGALSLILDTPFVVLRTQDATRRTGSIRAASAQQSRPNEIEEVARWFPGMSEVSPSFPNEQLGEARKEYEKRIDQILDLEEEMDAFREKLNTPAVSPGLREAAREEAENYLDELESKKEEIVSGVPVRDSRLLELRQIIALTLESDHFEPHAAMIQLGATDDHLRENQEETSKAPFRLWSALFGEGRTLGREFVETLFRIMVERAGRKPGPWKKSGRFSEGDAADRLPPLRLLKQKDERSLPEDPEKLKQEVVRSFPPLEAFTRQVEAEFREILAYSDRSWVESDHAYPNRWVCEDHGASLGLFLVSGESPEVGEGGFRTGSLLQSYWFSSQACTELLKGRLRERQQEGRKGDSSKKAVRDFSLLWRHGFPLESSIIGTVHTTGVPLYLKDASRDIRRFSYDPEVRDLEEWLVSGGETADDLDQESQASDGFTSILQIPILFSDPNAVGDNWENADRYLTWALVVLATRPLDPILVLQIWEFASRLGPAADAAQDAQSLHWKVNLEDTQQAYEEQARSWSHEAGQVTMLLSDHWVMDFEKAQRKIEKEKIPQGALGIPLGSLFRAVRDYLWIWAPPKNQRNPIVPATRSSVGKYLKGIAGHSKNASFAQMARNISNTYRSWKRARDLFSEKVDVHVITEESVHFNTDYWESLKAISKEEKQKRENEINYLSRAIAACLTNAIGHTGFEIGNPETPSGKVFVFLNMDADHGQEFIVVNSCPEYKAEGWRARRDGDDHDWHTKGAVNLFLRRLRPFRHAEYGMDLLSDERMTRYSHCFGWNSILLPEIDKFDAWFISTIWCQEPLLSMEERHETNTID